MRYASCAERRCRCEAKTPPEVVELDLYKTRLYSDPLPAALRRKNFALLARSARKLSAAGASLTSQELAIVGL